MQKHKNTASIILIFGILVFVFLLQSINSPIGFIIETNYLSQPYDKKGLIKGGLFLASYFLSVMAILTSIFIVNRYIAFLWISFFALLFGIDAYVQFLGSSSNGVTVALLSTAFSEVGRVEDLLVYKKPLLYALLVAILFFILASLARSLVREKYRIKTIWSLLFLISTIVGVGLLTYKIFSIKSQAYPAPIKMLLVLKEYWSLNHNDVERVLDSAVKPSQTNGYKTIVWIIDESISGKYLSLNGYAKNTTPFLESIKNSHFMQNYGIVASISNCSNTSNLFLRIGLTSSVQQEFLQAKKSLPTIFQYAKNANFTTYLLDAQVTPGELQNNLTGNDLKFIDHNISYERTVLPQSRDKELLTSLSNLLSNTTENQFIVVVKWGAHWPYPLAYPKEQSLFSPAATETLTEMTIENKAIITNAYLNAVHYSVDTFLQNLLEKKNLDNKVIFYTSDHGQSLFSNDKSALTHCHYSDKPDSLPLDEFKVPLMVFTKDAKTYFPKLENRLYAQEQLFPSTLQILGYSGLIYNIYGPTLFQGSEAAYVEAFVLDSGVKVKIPKP